MKAIILSLLVSTHAFAFGANDIYMKGADLYSWKDAKGAIWFSLLPGTNRQKYNDELVSARANSKEIMAQLSKLPPGTWIAWNNPILLDNPNRTKFAMPPKDDEARMRRRMKELGLVVR